MKETCKNCKFFEEDKYSNTHGDCHKYPPTIYGFPTVNLNSWCGEWKKKVK